MKLLEETRIILRRKHYSKRMEEAYTGWIKRYVRFHNFKHPIEMGAEEITAFLNHLAVKEKVAASTQNQAMNALVFLYKNVLDKDTETFCGLIWAKKPKKLPVVFTPEEAKTVIDQLADEYNLMANLMYGSGLRLMECLRLRVQDIDFSYNQISVRSGKGDKDRMTLLPVSIIPILQQNLKQIKKLHNKDLVEGRGSVYLPYALSRKYPRADKEWKWQYVFPSYQLSTDPRSGKLRRHHIHEGSVQAAIRKAIKNTGILKPAAKPQYSSFPTLRPALGKGMPIKKIKLFSLTLLFLIICIIL